MKSVRSLTFVFALAVLVLPLTGSVQSDNNPPDAPTGFDEQTNGHTDQATFDANQEIFDELEEIDEGLGPTFNMRGCGECHNNPVTGGISQVTELRAGHFTGTSFVDHPGGSLVHSQATDAALQELVLDGNEVRTFRTSLNTLGDGFVEAIANGTLVGIRDNQPSSVRGTIVNVPVVEAGGFLRVGRFGWKAQHASLESFSGDAYLNEMGITNLVNGFEDFAQENTFNGAAIPRCPVGVFTGPCDPVDDPEDGGDDVLAFAEFMRATKAPPRGPITSTVTQGDGIFRSIGCERCHESDITTAPAGTLINGGRIQVSAALGNKVIRPFGDFLLHDVGTGDGIVQNGGQGTRNKLRTPPLWGVRTRNRLMHDGESLNFTEAIQRHAGQATTARNNFLSLSSSEKAKVIAFLKSL